MADTVQKLVRSKHPDYGNANWTVDLYVAYRVNPPDIAKNVTPIDLGMAIDSDYNIGEWSDFNGSYIGLSKSGSDCKKFDGTVPYGKGKRWLITDQRFYIKHNSAGEASPTIYWKLGVDSPWAQYQSPSGSFKITVPDIPRISKVTANSGYIGSAITINAERKSSTFLHKLTYSFGSATGTIATNVKTGYKWIPSMSLCNQIPNSKSGKCTIKCGTYASGKKIGESAVTVSLSAPASTAPKASSGWCVISADNGTVTAAQDKYVKGISKAKAKFDKTKLTPQYGATIKSYKIVYDGKSIGSPYTTALLNAVGEKTVKAYAYDSRGYTYSENFTINIEDYNPPSLSSVTLFRSDVLGSPADQGTYIAAQATVSYSSVAGINTSTLTVRYKPALGSYGDAYPMESGKQLVIGDGLVSFQATYEAEVKVVDSFGESDTFTQIIPSDSVLFQALRGGTAGAFGKYAEVNDALDLAWSLILRKQLFAGIKGDVPVPLPIERRTAPNWTVTLYDDGNALCEGEFTIQSALSKAWGNGFVSDVALTAKKYPIAYIKEPWEICTVDSSYACWCYGKGSPTLTESAEYRAARFAVGASTVDINFHIKVFGKYQ